MQGVSYAPLNRSRKDYGLAIRLHILLIAILMTGDVIGSVHDVRHLGGDHVSLSCDGCSPAAESDATLDTRPLSDCAQSPSKVFVLGTTAAYFPTLVHARSPRAPPQTA